MLSPPFDLATVVSPPYKHGMLHALLLLFVDSISGPPPPRTRTPSAPVPPLPPPAGRTAALYEKSSILMEEGGWMEVEVEEVG